MEEKKLISDEDQKEWKEKSNEIMNYIDTEIQEAIKTDRVKAIWLMNSIGIQIFLKTLNASKKLQKSENADIKTIGKSIEGWFVTRLNELMSKGRLGYEIKPLAHSVNNIPNPDQNKL